MYITENLKSYLAKSEQFTSSEAFSGITARGFIVSQLVGDCADEDDDEVFFSLCVTLGDCGKEAPDP